MARPRSSLAVLEGLVRCAEVGGTNLGEHLAECAGDLGPRLGIEADDLRSLVHLPDEALAQQLVPHFQRRAEHRAAIHADAVQRVSRAAAEQLATTALWREDAAVLDIRVLLGELLVDPTRSYIFFDADGLAGRFQVALPRSLLVNASKAIGARPDLGAWVDEAGVHFRWNGGRGGINLLSRSVPAQEMPNILCVIIPPPYVERPRPPRAARRPSPWFSDLLAEMALA
jgi:hypothetical protein